MVITNIGNTGSFSSELAHAFLSNNSLWDSLIKDALYIMKKNDYKGLTIDFEYVYPNDKNAFINFISKMRDNLKNNNYFLSVAVAPKTSADQKGLLYEAHDYKQIGELADHVIIMTYEWGYSKGPAMAVAPINAVMKVLDYATSVINPNKILLGIPNYGYDWTLPFVEGSTAKTISNNEAIDIWNTTRPVSKRSFHIVRIFAVSQLQYTGIVKAGNRDTSFFRFVIDGSSTGAKIRLCSCFGQVRQYLVDFRQDAPDQRINHIYGCQKAFHCIFFILVFKHHIISRRRVHLTSSAEAHVIALQTL
jgi:hypothetical protein